MREAANTFPADRPEGRCELAELLMDLSRFEEAALTWQEASTAYPDEAIRARCWRGVRSTRRSRHCVSVAIRGPGTRAGSHPENLIPDLQQLREQCRTELGYSEDDLDDRGHLYLDARTAIDEGSNGADQRMLLSIPWLPADTFREARQRWPELAQRWDQHAKYHAAHLKHITTMATAGPGQVWIVPIDIQSYASWCEDNNYDPATSAARYAYAADQASGPADNVIVWPPERNAPCWCSSTTKYKKCCGSPHERLSPQDASAPMLR